MAPKPESKNSNLSALFSFSLFPILGCPSDLFSLSTISESPPVYLRDMFGRVRASPSPLDSLETPPSKIIKDDSLSIYEATLMKLKLGSQRHLISLPVVATEETDCVSETVPESTHDLSSETMNVEVTCSSGTVSRSRDQDEVSSGEKAMVIDTDCSSTTISNSLSDRQSTGHLNSQQRSEGVSIFYLFSKFKGYLRAPTIGHEADAMMMENDGSASFSSSSECQSLRSATEQANQESSGSSSLFRLCQ